jgi:hypothetical protein
MRIKDKERAEAAFKPIAASLQPLVERYAMLYLMVLKK